MRSWCSRTIRSPQAQPTTCGRFRGRRSSTRGSAGGSRWDIWATCWPSSRTTASSMRSWRTATACSCRSPESRSSESSTEARSARRGQRAQSDAALLQLGVYAQELLTALLQKGVVAVSESTRRQNPFVRRVISLGVDDRRVRSRATGAQRRALAAVRRHAGRPQARALPAALLRRRRAAGASRRDAHHRRRPGSALSPA